MAILVGGQILLSFSNGFYTFRPLSSGQMARVLTSRGLYSVFCIRYMVFHIHTKYTKTYTKYIQYIQYIQNIQNIQNSRRWLAGRPGTDQSRGRAYVYTTPYNIKTGRIASLLNKAYSCNLASVNNLQQIKLYPFTLLSPFLNQV